jgi:hypothetical protein
MYVTATAPIRHGRPHTTLCEEVNERYLHHPVTGSFAVRTEGEITWWDTFAAHRSESLRHTGRSGTRPPYRSGSKRNGSRNEVAVPPRREPRAGAVRCTDGGTKGTQGR